MQLLFCNHKKGNSYKLKNIGLVMALLAGISVGCASLRAPKSHEVGMVYNDPVVAKYEKQYPEPSIDAKVNEQLKNRSYAITNNGNEIINYSKNSNVNADEFWGNKIYGNYGSDKGWFLKNYGKTQINPQVLKYIFEHGIKDADKKNVMPVRYFSHADSMIIEGAIYDSQIIFNGILIQGNKKFRDNVVNSLLKLKNKSPKHYKLILYNTRKIEPNDRVDSSNSPYFKIIDISDLSAQQNLTSTIGHEARHIELEENADTEEDVCYRTTLEIEYALGENPAYIDYLYEKIKKKGWREEYKRAWGKDYEKAMFQKDFFHNFGKNTNN